MDDLIKLIIKHEGRSTDYRIEITGIKVLPPGVELKITHLESKDNVELVVP
jgi:hypothetical protein